MSCQLNVGGEQNKSLRQLLHAAQEEKESRWD